MKAEEREEAIDLLPCPFCGSDAAVYTENGVTGVGCSLDGCIVGNSIVNPLLWNRRAASVDRAGIAPKCGNSGFEPYDPEIFDECGGVRLDLIKPIPPTPTPSSVEVDHFPDAGNMVEGVEDRKCSCDSDGLCKYHGELEDRAKKECRCTPYYRCATHQHPQTGIDGVEPSQAAKEFVCTVADGNPWEMNLYASIATAFAQLETARQTPAIIERFIREVQVDAISYDLPLNELTELMQTAKNRQLGGRRMIEMTLKSGQRVDVEYGISYGPLGNPEVVIEEVWDKEGNEVKTDDFTEPERQEIEDACWSHANNPENFCDRMCGQYIYPWP